MGLQFGDTTMTKVFVGGLAWETQKDALREHFEEYGEILEAVVISDKVTGRSKGYGFVTFKESDSAKKAVEDPTPIINGRRANCNIASLGAHRTLKASPPTTPTPVAGPPPRQPIGSRAPPAQWYYAPPAGALQPPPSLMHRYPRVDPYYAAAAAFGYSPYNMADLGYNGKQSYSNAVGSYVQGHYYPAAQGGMISPNALMPMYPMYHPYHHHHHHHRPHSQSMPHFFPQTYSSGAITTVIPKHPAAMPPAAGEQLTGCS